MVTRPSEQESEILAHNLGVLFIHFGVLEHTLSTAIAAAFGLTTLQERSFVRGMFARQKVELLRSYAKKHWTEQAQEDLKPLFDEALVLIDYRNDFAHGVIMHDENGKWGVITFRGGNRFEGKAEGIDVNVLGQKGADIAKVSVQFEELAKNVELGKIR